jgi:hypothetical protein
VKALRTIRNLAGGRVPPLTQTALISGCIVFLTALCVFHPEAGGQAPASPLANGVVLMPNGHPLTEGVVLLDTSALFLPTQSSVEGVGVPEVNQPEDNPFGTYKPKLRFDPTKPVDLPLEDAKPEAIAPQEAIPLAQWEPFKTLGAENLKQYPVVGRKGFYEVFSISGAKTPLIYGNMVGFNGNFDAKIEKNETKSPIINKIEVVLGVDSMGLQGAGSLIRSSGSPSLDAAVQQWVRGVDWARRLPPGTYRITLGP